MQSRPASIGAEVLCDMCAAAVPSIRRLLHPKPDASNSVAAQRVLLSSIRSIQVKKDTCMLCKLVNHALTQSWGQVPLYSKARINMFSPLLDTRAVLVGAEPVTNIGKEDLPQDLPCCLHVEVMLDGARPLVEDVGLSGGVTQARDMAGFKIGGHERSFQPEIRLLQQAGGDGNQEKKDFGLAREIGHVCPSDRLRGWYRSCVDTSSHEKGCAATRIISDEDFDTPKGQPPLPPRLPDGTRLIDVDAMKLVLAGQMHDIEYAALSYTWGDKDIRGLKTTESNMDERHIDGSLRNAPLPKTISDAVELARDLGIQYLWADALCIVQDAGAEKDVQIEAMDKIYGVASLVIIAAAGGDSNAGLVGFRTTPRPAVSRGCGGKEKDCGQFIADVQDLRLAVSPPPLQRILAASVWQTRGWTCQEWRFARRSLIFTATQVYFLCGSTSFSEDLVLESGSPAKPAWQVAFRCGPAATERHSVPGKEFYREVLGVSSGWAAYVEAAESFSPRSVRDPTDTLKALAGILRNLHLATRNRFVAGVSVGLLHDALLWVPVVGHPDRAAGRRVSTRVTTSENSNGWRTGAHLLPSWSWAEWDGAVNYGVIPPGEAMVEEFKVIFTEPALGSEYRKPKDSDEDEHDSTSAANTKRNFIRRLFLRFRKESRLDIFRREYAELQRELAVVYHANLLGHPLTEPQTDRPFPGMTFFAKRPQLYGDNPADGAEAEAKRAGKPLRVGRSAAGFSSVSLEDDPSGQLLPPIYSYRCLLFFKAAVATLQIAPVLNDLLGRADGVLDLDGRYIGVALLDQPRVPKERILQGFCKVDVVALSHSALPTRYVMQGAFSDLAGLVGGEAPEWIGLLIVGEAVPRKKEGEQSEERSDDEKRTRSFFRIGVAQVVKEAWEMWVEKRYEEILLR